MTSVLPKPPRVAFTNPDGTLTRDGDAYIRGLFARAGGSVASTNTELADLIAALSAGEMLFQPSQGTPLFPDVLQPTVADFIFADVLQSAPFADLGETTFQH